VTVTRAKSINRQWVENRREVIDARMNELEFFGAALEDTPLREEFWPSYEQLADAVLSLRNGIIDCMEANDRGDAGQSACVVAARRHVEDAALRLSQLAQDPIVRRSMEGSRSELYFFNYLRRWSSDIDYLR
jgi:hypothetical protein